jgi:hypothetical protein
MAFGVYFEVQGMSPQKFADVHARLKEIGQDKPPGRSFHAGYNVNGQIQVFDIWESMEAFEAFGQHLMPILTEHGIDPGEPRIGELELTIQS